MLLAKALLAVWPTVWDVDVLWRNVISPTGPTRSMAAVWELVPSVAVTVTL